MIENIEEIKKRENIRNLVFFYLYLVWRMKKWRNESFICLIEKKSEMIEIEIDIYLQLCSC